MEIPPDIPIQSQLAIHAEVMRIAQKYNLPLKSAFYILMKRYKQALVVSDLERIPVKDAIVGKVQQAKVAFGDGYDLPQE